MSKPFQICATLPALMPHCTKWERWDGKTWIFASAMAVEIIRKDMRYSMIVSPGFTTDGGSIPRVFWRVAGHPLGDWLLAYLVHDAFYASEYLPRSLADEIFLEILCWLGAPRLIRNAAWGAVRGGGLAVWKQHSEETIAAARALIHIDIERLT